MKSEEEIIRCWNCLDDIKPIAGQRCSFALLRPDIPSYFGSGTWYVNENGDDFDPRFSPCVSISGFDDDIGHGIFVSDPMYTYWEPELEDGKIVMGPPKIILPDTQEIQGMITTYGSFD